MALNMFLIRMPRCKNAKEEVVGSWTNANHIHKWFAKHVGRHDMDAFGKIKITRQKLERLRDVCRVVLDSCELTNGKAIGGYMMELNERVPIMIEGLYVKDSKIAQKYLPTASGFAIGSTHYNDEYVAEVRRTMEIVNDVLKTTNFRAQQLFYIATI